MAEHIGRYEEFAEYLADRGFHVVGSDHRGHGRTGERARLLGRLAHEDRREPALAHRTAHHDWSARRRPRVPRRVMGRRRGSARARRHAPAARATHHAARWPDWPRFRAGHRMGSWLARRYLQRFGDTLDGAVLMGTPGHPGFIGKFGRWVSKLEVRRRGLRKPNPFLARVAFFGNNKR